MAVPAWQASPCLCGCTWCMKLMDHFGGSAALCTACSLWACIQRLRVRPFAMLAHAVQEQVRARQVSTSSADAPRRHRTSVQWGCLQTCGEAAHGCLSAYMAAQPPAGPRGLGIQVQGSPADLLRPARPWLLAGSHLGAVCLLLNRHRGTHLAGQPPAGPALQAPGRPGAADGSGGPPGPGLHRLLAVRCQP